MQNDATDDTNGDGGAILYRCDPKKAAFKCRVSLFDNQFIQNSAYITNSAICKGGALRYENANFTNIRLIEET